MTGPAIPSTASPRTVWNCCTTVRRPGPKSRQRRNLPAGPRLDLGLESLDTVFGVPLSGLYHQNWPRLRSDDPIDTKAPRTLKGLDTRLRRRTRIRRRPSRFGHPRKENRDALDIRSLSVDCQEGAMCRFSFSFSCKGNHLVEASFPPCFAGDRSILFVRQGLCRPGPVSCSWPSSWTCTRGRWSAGACRPHRAPGSSLEPPSSNRRLARLRDNDISDRVDRSVSMF